MNEPTQTSPPNVADLIDQLRALHVRMAALERGSRSQVDAPSPPPSSTDELRTSLDRTQGLLDAAIHRSPVGVLVCDSNQVVRDANRALTTILGVPDRVLAGFTLQDMWDHWPLHRAPDVPWTLEDVPIVRAVTQREASGDFTAWTPTPDGSHRWLSMSATPLWGPDGGLDGALMLVLDETERTETLHALRQANARHEEVLDTLDDFVVEWVLDGTRTYVNRSYATFFGATKEELIGTSFFPLIAPEDRARVQRRLASLSPASPSSEDIHRVLLADGTEGGWQHWLDRGSFDDDGNLVSVLSSGRDITPVMKLRAEAMELADRWERTAELTEDLLAVEGTTGQDALAHALRRLAAHHGLLSATLWWLDPETLVGTRVVGFDAPGSPEVPPRIDLARQMPGIGARLVAEERVVIADTSDAPELERGAANLRATGTGAAVLIPVTARGARRGVVAFTRGEPEDWSPELLAELDQSARLLATAVARFESERALDAAAAELRELSARVQEENVYLREEVARPHGFTEIVGQSPPLLACLQAVDQVAPTDTPVLLLGETGTGKELFARAVHSRSERRRETMTSVNCAALPASLVESELFGHEKGAFTGAVGQRRGRFELADGGTLFLDEVGELPLAVQAKLLRVLQDGEIERVGGTASVSVDVRIVAATNRDLEAEVVAGRFRADLFYRLAVFPIELPPLRERPGDIELLATELARRHARLLGRELESLTARLVDWLRTRTWPGNVRELENTIRRLLISSTGPTLDRPEWTSADPRAPAGGDLSLDSVQRQHIIDVLEQTGGRIEGDAGAADLLGLAPSTLRSKMKRLGIGR